MGCFCGQSDGAHNTSQPASSNQLPLATSGEQDPPTPTQRCGSCSRFFTTHEQANSPHANTTRSCRCWVKSASSRCGLTLDVCKSRREEEAERIIKFFDGLFSFVIGTAALGAGFTFPTILAKLDPAPTGIFHESVHTFLAVSWVLFILALASAGFFASIIGFGKDFAKYNLNFGTDHLDEHCYLRWFGALASGIPVMLLIAAFMFLSFVVVAFENHVGWVAVGASSLFGLAGLLGTLIQSPLGDPVTRALAW